MFSLDQSCNNCEGHILTTRARSYGRTGRHAHRAGGRAPGEGVAVPEHTTLQGDKTQRKGLSAHSGFMRHHTQERRGKGDSLHSPVLPPRDRDQCGLRKGRPLRCGEQSHSPSGFLKALDGLPCMLLTTTKTPRRRARAPDLHSVKVRCPLQLEFSLVKCTRGLEPPGRGPRV